MKKYLAGTALAVCLFASTAFADLTEALTAFNVKRYDQALAEFSYLADEGDATAYYYLGKMYAEGLGVEQDTAKAVEYYQKAEKMYNIDAAYELAQVLLKEAKDSSDEKFSAGLDYLKRSAYAGQADALLQLGEMYENGTFVDLDYKSAFGFYLMSALKGNARAQFKLSVLYLTGRGVPQDYENGLKWIARSAKQGYVLAQEKLAFIRSSAPGLKNLPDAYAWYSIIAAYNSEDEIGQEAAKKRNALEKSIKKKDVLIAKQRAAREWRPIPPEKSVPASDLLVIPTPVIPGFNDPEAIQNMLAQGEVLLTDGRKYLITTDMIVKASITKDFKAIENAVEKAVQKGNIDAYAYYADLLYTRFQNAQGAVDWYRKGAEAGDAYAQYQLARVYCEGRGIDAPRPGQCYAWLKIAEEKSTDTLKLTIQNALQTVEMEITPEEKDQGEKLLAEYSAKNPAKKDIKDDILNLF